MPSFTPCRQSIETRLGDCRHPVTVAVVVCSLIVLGLAGEVHGDWPTYRADAARTGFTAEPLEGELTLAWSYDAGAPTPAWPRSGRMPFDRAFHCVVAGQQVFFANSTDHALYRLDLRTGRGDTIFCQRWTVAVCTDGLAGSPVPGQR